MLNELDELFARLRDATAPAEIEVLQNGIWLLWLSSGDQALDKEMEAGMRALQADEYSAAITAFDRIVLSAPHWAEGWNKRATAYYFRGEYRASLSDIAETLRREPRHFGALWGQFNILSQLGETRRALQVLNRLEGLCAYFPGLREQQFQLRERLQDEGQID